MPDLFGYSPPRYPETPGYSNHTTSKAAAAAIVPVKSALAAKVLECLERRPMTCFELEQKTGLSHQTASARVRDLALAGRIVDSGAKRPTASGRNAIVWQLA